MTHVHAYTRASLNAYACYVRLLTRVCASASLYVYASLLRHECAYRPSLRELLISSNEEKIASAHLLSVRSGTNTGVQQRLHNKRTCVHMRNSSTLSLHHTLLAHIHNDSHGIQLPTVAVSVRAIKHASIHKIVEATG